MRARAANGIEPENLLLNTEVPVPDAARTLPDHYILLAEPGFSPLTHFAGQFGISPADEMAFARDVNTRNEAGTLLPRAPITTVPGRSVRGATSPAALTAHLVEFLRHNATTVHAKRLCFDFTLECSAKGLVLAAIGAAMADPAAACVEYFEVHAEPCGEDVEGEE